MISPTRGLIMRACRTQCRFASSTPRPPRPNIKTPTSRRPPKISKAYIPTPRKSRSPPSPSNSSTPASPAQAETLRDLWASTWLPLTGAALLAGALGFYIFGTAAASFKATPCSCTGEHSTPTGRPPALDGDNAEQFDKELALPEWWMGITKLRKRIAERANGHVLELAMGTGRNLEYFNWEPLTLRAEGKAGAKPPQGVVSFTGLDISVDMMDVARKRLVKTVPPMENSAPIVRASTMADHTGGQLSYLDSQLRLIHSDAHHPIPGPATTATTKYDTVIQTFGLCSVSDPVAVVNNLAKVVKPRSGRIILLEHGKGWYGIINGLLDRNAGKHFEKYGCWWNRDIEALVEEAVAKTPGLEIVKVERPNIMQMGTLVWVELKVKDNTS
ncbi:Methyltransferase OMS1 mitochondrial [Fusarium circinatum]|uniref:Methyltransferase OMS1 mitochondrial n=1 Tax=Fusarium circinatum TaxID=48490 RepID=A0A8H5THI7_FUSCI|nr:Methyltransferase OMS1 mitochondrial [Fusarium circinatum]